MGWAGGGNLADDVWGTVRGYIPPGYPRKMVARRLIAMFESLDCDTIYEAEQLCIDAGWVLDDGVLADPKPTPAATGPMAADAGWIYDENQGILIPLPTETQALVPLHCQTCQPSGEDCRCCRG